MHHRVSIYMNRSIACIYLLYNFHNTRLNSIMGVVYNAMVTVRKVCNKGTTRLWHRFSSPSPSPSIAPSLSATSSPSPSYTASPTPSSSAVVPSLTPSVTPSTEPDVVIIPTPYPTTTPSIIERVKKLSFWGRVKKRFSRWFR